MPKKSTLDKMDTDVLLCRTERHLTPTYHDHDLVYAKGVLVSYERTTTCQRCGWVTTKVLVWGPRGYEVQHYRPVYQDGYLNEEGRLSMPQVRTEQMLRAGYRAPGHKRRPKAKS